MITVFKTNGEILRTITNDDFFNHITAMELLDLHPEFDDEASDWCFTTFTGAIEFCTGDSQKPVWIPITPAIDVSRFRKYWYLAYCEAHQYDYAVTHANGEIEIKRITAPYNKLNNQEGGQ